MAARPENAEMPVDQDTDPQETQEWQDALTGVIEHEGTDRAHFLIEQMIAQAREEGIDIPYSATTEYINTIPADRQPKYPGDADIEIRIRNYIRWNAMAMVVRANRDSNVGGHIASFASSAALYDVGFNWFWRAQTENHGGDLIFFQGHSIPGVYSRAFLMDRLTEEQLNNFRQEVGGKGLSSYPHPWLMPDFWRFPTVSMGLGPIQAIYQARFMKYMDSRGFIDAKDRKVWAFLGDGETDEVESLGAIGMAAREKLDNLIFVINCNLQRLDGPVRGNGKIIQELEAEFRGAGWNVIKLIWGTHWDALFARDKKGIMKKRMMELCDGEYQTFKAKNGAYVREHFFNTPELRALVADWTDDEVWNLNRGGHDIFKIFTAYNAAVTHKGAPTLILAKTIKGFGMGQAGEAMNISHQQKKMDVEAIRRFRASGSKGRLVNTASGQARQGFIYTPHYAASKFGVIGLTQSLAKELAPEGITVKLLLPVSNLTMTGHRGQPPGQLRSNGHVELCQQLVSQVRTVAYQSHVAAGRKGCLRPGRNPPGTCRALHAEVITENRAVKAQAFPQDCLQPERRETGGQRINCVIDHMGRHHCRQIQGPVGRQVGGHELAQGTLVPGDRKSVV